MASIGHIAVGMAAGRFSGRKDIARAMLWFSAASMLPDADVIGFAFGVSYGSSFGHRGASHALAAAPVLAILPSLVLDLFDRTKPRLRTWILMTAVIATHGLLDTLTDGGLGSALAWPWSSERFFAPWNPIPVSPLGAAFLSLRGLYVAAVEVAVFSPLLAYALWPRRKRSSGEPEILGQ